MPARPELAGLTDAKATALLTLFARARQSRSADPVLRDPWAEQAVERLELPLGRPGGEWRDRLLAARARQLDAWTREFLAEHPRATVLHLGCGLDSRVFRVDPPTGVRWLDVDYPETIELRRRLYPDPPGDYRAIGAPLTDLAWLDSLLAEGPAIAVAEGVFMYLTEDTLSAVLRRIVGHFSSGRLAFDAHSRRIVRLQELTGTTVHETGARFRWGMRSRRDIPRLEPRLRFRRRRSGASLAQEVGLAWPGPLFIRLLGAMTLLMYEF